MSIMDGAKEKWSGAIAEVTLGATAEEGGSRSAKVTVGGTGSLPYMHFEGPTPHSPAIAMEVWDCAPDDWADPLVSALGSVMKSPADWAKKCVEEFGADLICLKLMGTHPDFGDASPEKAAEVVKSVLAAAGVPLIIWGSEHDDKDNEVLPLCSQAAAGERCLIGTVKGCRTVSKHDMVRNHYLPKIDVDSQTYEVRADGELLVCEPASVLPLAQRYFLF